MEKPSQRRFCFKQMNLFVIGIWFKQQRKKFDYFLKLSLLIFLMTLLVKKVDFSQVWLILSEVSFSHLALTLIVYIVARYLLALQMATAFRFLHQKIAISKLFKIQLIMSFYSIVLPGELMAGGIGWYKVTQLNEKAVESAALIIYVRIVNILVLLILGMMGIVFDPQPDTIPLRTIIFALLIFLSVATLPFFSAKINSWFQKILLSLTHQNTWPQIIAHKIIHFLQTINALNRMPLSVLLPLITLAILVEVLHTITHYLMALAVGINLPFLVLVWIRAAITLLQMLPISFAGLGIREVSLLWFLQHYSVPNAQALSFSLVIFAYLVVTGMLGGLVEAYEILFSFKPHPKN